MMCSFSSIGIVSGSSNRFAVEDRMNLNRTQQHSQASSVHSERCHPNKETGTASTRLPTTSLRSASPRRGETQRLHCQHHHGLPSLQRKTLHLRGPPHDDLARDCQRQRPDSQPQRVAQQSRFQCNPLRLSPALSLVALRSKIADV